MFILDTECRVFFESLTSVYSNEISHFYETNYMASLTHAHVNTYSSFMLFLRNSLYFSENNKLEKCAGYAVKFNMRYLIYVFEKGTYNFIFG